MVDLWLLRDELLVLPEWLLVLFEFCCEFVGLSYVVLLCFEYLAGEAHDLFLAGLFLLPQLVD